MESLKKVNIKPEDIIKLLKQEIRLREAYQKIWYEKIITKAVQERNLTVTPEEVQAEAENQRREKRLEKASDTFSWLEEQMITPDDWEAGIRQKLYKKKLSEHLFSQQVNKVFAENRINFEQVILYQIIVPYERVAQELFYQIEEEEISFYEAAHLYDIEEERRLNCGYEGKVYRWSLHPDIAAVIFRAQPGEITPPVKTEAGYHIFKVEEFMPAQLTPEVYQEILEGLFKQWLNSELTYLLHNQESPV